VEAARGMAVAAAALDLYREEEEGDLGRVSAEEVAGLALPSLPMKGAWGGGRAWWSSLETESKEKRRRWPGMRVPGSGLPL